MISREEYATLSLELHLFFGRIMKEHSLFLEAGFTPKNTKLSKEAEHYKVSFEKLLLDTVKLSNGRIRESVIDSGEIFTEYTLETEKKTKYYVVREKAVPEVLLKVVEAKRILDSERATTVQEATEQVGISRSSFYKYKDDIFPFHDQAKGRTVTFILQMDDKPGILSDILRTVAEFRGNILTIHQSIPINGIATLTLSVEILPEAGDAEDMIGQMEQQTGVHYLKILGRE